MLASKLICKQKTQARGGKGWVTNMSLSMQVFVSAFKTYFLPTKRNMTWIDSSVKHRTRRTLLPDGGLGL